MDYIELHHGYMLLQSIHLSRMTILERDELQKVLSLLVYHEQTTQYDLLTYYMPRHNTYDQDIETIKQYTNEQIGNQQAVIVMAQQKIVTLRDKLCR